MSAPRLLRGLDARRDARARLAGWLVLLGLSLGLGLPLSLGLAWLVRLSGGAL